MAERRAADDLFVRARAVPVEAIVPYELRRQGARLIGPCPVCGGTARSARFQVDTKRNLWCCFACPPAHGQKIAGGGPIELALRVTQARGAREAAEWLAGFPAGWMRARSARSGGNERARARDQRKMRMQRLAREIWQGSAVATGGPVARYLAARGIRRDLVDAVLATGRLRYHPAAPAAWSRGRASLCAPAMVAPVVRPCARGEDGGIVWRHSAIHVTYLAAGGAAKARLVDPEGGGALPAKRMFGRVAGACVVLGLEDPACGMDAPLIVAEGIETALALMQRTGRRARAVAALSLGNLQGGWRTDRDGAIDLDAPIADAERPPFLIADPGEVWIGIDADMAPVRMRIRHPDRRVREKSLDAAARARLAARLAAQHWRRAGATRVRILRPRIGADFADEAREAAA